MKKRKNITAIIVKKSKILNSMSQNKRMKNKSVIKRKASKRKNSRSKVVSLVIASVKVAITAMIGQLFRKKSTCMLNLSFMGVEVVGSSMITDLLITRNILILKSSITSKDSMIIIPDSNIVMMIFMPLISLFIIEEGEVRSIIMIGNNILNHIKIIILLWEGFNLKDITMKDLRQLLMDKGTIMSKMIDSRDSSKVKVKD